MSVSHRVTGTWAELTADGVVAIPATPQAGDRMYLFARWKDFSVTATVANWTELSEFADGSTGSGNGTGSVKVGCWYRDWQSGDSDPTIDFSASPNSASVVITVMQKGADDVWLTPVAVTAAMTNWTTSSQSVAASSTATVPSSGVVIGLIGIRDDTATMARPTTGIDDSGGLVTWNGNYVESPATHHSTTTGDDGAADLGYRLVTTGAAGATLRLTGTISAAETGAALWVVQGVSVVVTPSIASLTVSRFAASLKIAVTVGTLALTTSAFAPSLRETVTPATVTVATTTFAPSLRHTVTPTAAALNATGFSPSLSEVTTPATSTLVLATFAPVLEQVAAPAPASLIITSFASTLNFAVVVPTATLTITSFVPHIIPPRIIWLDPGGDAVQVVGYFNTLVGGTVTFDSTEQVVGVGSWKFDSGAGNDASRVAVAGLLGDNRRGSFYFRYDGVSDTEAMLTKLAESNVGAYSGGGFADVGFLADDDGAYATATPARNAGQGTAFGSFGFDSIPIGAIVDSVKITYERSYDAVGGLTSIGISRVKYRLDGVEGPDHDNTDMPLTDTVVEVDVTSDRSWERQDLLDGMFEVIAEARRGDTDTEHTQSWDYMKVEVVYHTAVPIWQARDVTGSAVAFELSLLPKGDGSCLRFSSGASGEDPLSYDGITELATNTWNRIGYAFTNPVGVTDDLHIKLYVNSIQELDISEAPTNNVSPANITYGWCSDPGDDKSCWFDQIYLDDGDDLGDVGNPLATAKLPATVNNDNFDTTGGTGAVNERPVDLANFRQQAATAQVNQDYTIQAANVGDVDISSETLRGHMGWIIAKKSGFSGTFGFILDGVTTGLNLTTTAARYQRLIASASYPSNAAGIGLQSTTSSNDSFLYECGVIQAYEGPANPNILLERQEIADETLDTIVDDLRADPPDSYELGYFVDDFDGLVTINISTLASESADWQVYPTEYSSGGWARFPLPAGIEVRIDVEAVGTTRLMIYKRVNV